MKKQIEPVDIPRLNREDLYDLINNTITTIKTLKLLERETGFSYTQARLADYIRLGRKEDISQAKNRKSTISTDRLQILLRQILQSFPSLKVYTDSSVVAGLDDASVLLDNLANKLALNLADVSTLINNEEIVYEAIFNNQSTYNNRPRQSPPRERYIAVVGAGGSYAATSRSPQPIPMAEGASYHLRNAFNRKVQRSFIDEEVNRLASLRQTSPDDFETQLVALAKFNQGLLLDALKELCGNRHVPAFEHEIIAHLLKNRFLDIVINFNYDELLDNAIEEELPNVGDHSFIYSPGQCPEKIADVMVHNRLKQPIYIKCQGTISFPNSLQFQHDKALVIDPAIQKHIMDLLMATAPEATEDDNSKAHYMPVNLLLIGFSFKNYVFRKLIEKAAENNPKGIKIWIFDTDVQLKSQIERTFDRLGAEVKNRCQVYFIPITPESPLRDRLSSLWSMVASKFKDHYEPRGIQRHTLVCDLFQDTSPIGLKGLKLLYYYQDRLLVEIAINIFLTDGLVHLSQIPNGRIGKYLALAKQQQRAMAINEKEIEGIHDYLNKLGMEIYENFMSDTYQLTASTTYAKQIRKSKQSSEEVSAHWASYFYDCLSKELKGKQVKQRLNELHSSQGENSLFRYIHGIRHRKLLTIHPKYNHPHQNLFSSLPVQHIFNTSFGWIYNYRKHIDFSPNQLKWDLMLAITEEGRFVKKDFKELAKKNKFFELVLAANGIKKDTDPAKEWLNNKRQLLSGHLKYRPWWMHNKHMVLLLERKRDSAGEHTPSAPNPIENWILREGFFYRQNLLTRQITPVKVTAQKDLIKLLRIYIIYWRGSTKERDLSKHKTTHLVTDEETLNKAIRELLLKFEDKTKKMQLPANR